VVATRAAWLAIKEVSGRGGSIGQERERHVNVDEQGVHAIVECTKDMFSKTILL
jgi:hypothetical protein